MHLTPSPGRVSLVAAALTVLAACADAPEPPTATAPPSARLVSATCDEMAIRRDINRLYPGNRARTHAQAAFQAALAADRAGRTTEAITGFLGLAGDLLTRFITDQLRDPPGATTLRQGTAALLDGLFGCAGIAPVSSQLPAVQTPLGGPGLFDVVTAVVFPGQSFDIRTPSDRFAFTDADGDFLDEPALVLIYRTHDAPPFAPTHFTEYPPRYHVDVLPYTAQENFDDDGNLVDGPEDVVLGTGATAVFSVCPNEPHPGPPGSLRVLRNPEWFLGAEPHLLPPAPSAPLTCAGHTQAPVFAAGGPEGRWGIGRLLAGMGRGLGEAGGRALALLGPAPLHAVDGGAGGRGTLASDFVAALPISPIASLDSVDLRNANDASVTTIRPGSDFPEPVLAVPMDRAAGYDSPAPIPADGIACTWTVDRPDRVTLGATTGLSNTIARVAPGAALVAVSCTDGTSTVNASLQVLDLVPTGG